MSHRFLQSFIYMPPLPPIAHWLKKSSLQNCQKQAKRRKAVVKIKTPLGKAYRNIRATFNYRQFLQINGVFLSICYQFSVYLNSGFSQFLRENVLKSFKITLVKDSYLIYLFLSVALHCWMIRKIAFKPTKNWQVKEKCTVVMKKRSFGLVRTFLQKSRTTIDACSKTCIIALNKKNNK